MAWKRKEKELSPEEAIAAAKADAAPFWAGLPPQFTVVDSPAGIQLFPLEPKFADQTWLLAFLDLTDVMGENMAIFLKEWRRRYAAFDIQTLLVLEAPGVYAQDKKLTAELLQDLELPNHYVVDQNQKIARGFGLKTSSGFLFYRGGRVHFSSSTVDEFPAFEQSLQTLLRIADPGLPLFPIFRPQPTFQRTITGIEFSAQSSFKPLIVTDPATTAGELRARLHPGEIALIGQWTRDQEKIQTSDSKARLVFLSPTPEIHVLAASLTKLIENGKVMIEVNETPPYQAYMGDHLSTDEHGQAYIPVRKFGLFKAIRALPEGPRLIEMRFPTASRIPVGLFGFRFVEVR